MLTTEDLPGVISRHRKLRGLSQKDMAEKLFISVRAYQRIEYGENKNIDVDTIQKIAAALGVGIAVLLENRTVTPEGILGLSPDAITLPARGKHSTQAYEEIIASLREIIVLKDELIRQLMMLCDRKIKKATG